MEISDLTPSWRRSLRGDDKADRTVETYLDVLDRFQTFLEAHGDPTEVTEIRRRHLEAHLTELRDKGYKPNTVATRFRCLQQFDALRSAPVSELPGEHDRDSGHRNVCRVERVRLRRVPGVRSRP